MSELPYVVFGFIIGWCLEDTITWAQQLVVGVREIARELVPKRLRLEDLSCYHFWADREPWHPDSYWFYREAMTANRAVQRREHDSKYRQDSEKRAVKLQKEAARRWRDEK